MNRNRKNRGGGGGARIDYHSNRGSRMRSVPAEGVYSNPHFMHAATAQVGNIVRIKAASGNVWEGVFKTFSSQFEVVLEVAAKVENADSHNSSLAADTYVDKLIFRPNDIISMSARDVDLDYPTKDVFQTDAAISARLNGQSGMGDEKVLEPWVPPCSINGGDTSLQLEPGSNGWDANDMFMTNEQSYGVQSTYDHTLTGYTVQLQATDSQDYREAEAKANEIAKEIENQPSYKARIELENGDEEERFAAVARPKPNQEFNKVEVENNNEKYVPPAKRKGQAACKAIRSTPPPAGPVVSATSANLKGAVPPMSYPTHPSPHANNNNNNNNSGSRDQAILHNMHQTPPPQVQQQQQQQQQHMPLQPNPQQQQQQHQMSLPQMNHRPHSHTPPAHVYNNRPPMKQMNGETKQMPQRPPRNVYPSTNMVQQAQSMHYQEQPTQPQQMQQQQQQQQPPMQSQQQHPKQQDMINNVPRHREESSKDLHKFSQDFKLAAIADQEPKHPMPQPTPPQQQQPQQSISPQQQDNIDKTNTVKKSSLNPDAKEFVMNPTAKPFTPRYASPITPTASRPHTPQTPSNPYIPTTGNGPQGPVSVLFPYTHCMPSCPPQPQGNRLRKFVGPMRNDMSHVAAATGQPLLHNMPSPMQPFAFSQNMNPQTYLRMFESPQLQYIQQNPPNIPNAAQPPPPYSTGQPQQQPPPQQYIYPLITAPHMMQAGMPYVQQPPPPPQGISVFMSHHQPQQHGPNP